MSLVTLRIFRWFYCYNHKYCSDGLHRTYMRVAQNRQVSLSVNVIVSAIVFFFFIQTSYFSIFHNFYCRSKYIIMCLKYRSSRLLVKIITEYICSYRIQHSIDIYRLPNPVQKKDRIAFQNISSAVDIHRKALELVAIYYFL